MDKRVLIIDDDKWVVMSTQMVLEAEGFEVKAATSGGEGLEVARAWRPSLILLDILMPGIDGWETLERLKADPVVGDVPVVVFTARGGPAGKTRYRELGAVGYFTKPFRPEALIETVRHYVEQAIEAQ
ncbi:MAG: response regulator [Planctomycetota bacterium]